jgi:hypothetical protein
VSPHRQQLTSQCCHCAELTRSPPEGVSVGPKDDNLFIWEIMIVGPAGTEQYVAYPRQSLLPSRGRLLRVLHRQPSPLVLRSLPRWQSVHFDPPLCWCGPLQLPGQHTVHIDYFRAFALAYVVLCICSSRPCGRAGVRRNSKSFVCRRLRTSAGDQFWALNRC